MNLGYIPLFEIIDSILLNYYVSDVHHLGCQVFSVSGDPVITVGDGAKVPKLSKKHVADLSAAPLPIDVPEGRAAGIFAKEELIGYVVVSAKNEQQALAADFVFEFIGFSVSRHLEIEDLRFTGEYLKNLIAMMQRLAQKTLAVFDSAKVAGIFVQECEKLFGVATGAVLESDGGKLAVLASFGLPFDDLEIAQQVVSLRKFYLSNEPKRNVLALPLMSGQDVVGVLYLRDKQTGPFGLEDQRMAQMMGAVLGATVGNIRLHRHMVENERVRATLSRYLSPNLLHEIVTSGRYQTLGGRRMQAAILFADIRGFTKVSELLAPEHIVAQLNEYFEGVVNVIFSHDGTLDKYVGISLWCCLGCLNPCPMRRCARCVRRLKCKTSSLRSSENGRQKWRVIRTCWRAA